jgi:xanthine dehydrogenase YagT iron-sulfur-binding subunit
MTATSADTARPARSSRRSGVLDEVKAGIPSHVTADITAPVQLSEIEIRERMSGNLCRCGAYSNIVDAVTEVAGLPTAGRQG